MAKIDLRATVEKVVRANGKNGAQIVITIPIKNAGDVPLGNVKLSLEEIQTELEFPSSKTPVRGITK